MIKYWEAASYLEELRKRGGGGVVTTLLLYALEKGIINKALVVDSSSEEPWARPKIAKSSEEILKSAGSKYCFIPYGTLVEQITPDSAVVGLPCQIRALRKYNVLKIGLFCGLNISPRGLNYLLNKLGVDKRDIYDLDYRAPGGGLLIKLKDGSIIRYPSYFWLSYFFPLTKCLYCRDFTNHYADISVGDRKPGWSNVIVRTDRGWKLFKGALEDGYLVANPLTEDEFLAKVMSPFIQKEIKGGYINTKLVRERGKWIEHIPLTILRLFGILIYHLSKRGMLF